MYMYFADAIFRMYPTESIQVQKEKKYATGIWNWGMKPGYETSVWNQDMKLDNETGDMRPRIKPGGTVYELRSTIVSTRWVKFNSCNSKIIKTRQLPLQNACSSTPVSSKWVKLDKCQPKINKNREMKVQNEWRSTHVSPKRLKFNSCNSNMRRYETELWNQCIKPGYKPGRMKPGLKQGETKHESSSTVVIPEWIKFGSCNSKMGEIRQL